MELGGVVQRRLAGELGLFQGGLGTVELGSGGSGRLLGDCQRFGNRHAQRGFAHAFQYGVETLDDHRAVAEIHGGPLFLICRFRLRSTAKQTRTPDLQVVEVGCVIAFDLGACRIADARHARDDRDAAIGRVTILDVDLRTEGKPGRKVADRALAQGDAVLGAVAFSFDHRHANTSLVGLRGSEERARRVRAGECSWE